MDNQEQFVEVVGGEEGSRSGCERTVASESHDHVAGDRIPSSGGGCGYGNSAILGPAKNTGRGADTENKEYLIKRLSDAAAYFWPSLTKDDRRDRIHDTLLEILEREQNGETHKIAWWAKWMYRRCHDRAVKVGKQIPTEDLSEYLSVVLPNQERHVDAIKAVALLERLPYWHREVMSMLAVGWDPVEISDKLRTPVTTIIRMIKESRMWIDDGGRYLDMSPETVKRLDARPN